MLSVEVLPKMMTKRCRPIKHWIHLSWIRIFYDKFKWRISE